MSSEALTRLGVPDAAAQVISGLTAEEQATFVATVRAAVEADTARVDKALDHTLKLVPAPLRGRARGILFPKGQA